MSNLYLTYKAQGLCQRCGKVPVAASFCEECRARREVKRKERAANARKSGRCSMCFQAIPEDGYLTCRSCIQKIRTCQKNKKSYPGGEE